MSGKVDFVPGSHGSAWLEGPATALSWLTIIPIRGAEAFDRTTGARVMASLPVVGIVFGLVGSALAWLFLSLHIFPFLSAVLIISAWQLFNRFMHLDGFADVADALGSYAPPQKARDILSDPHAGLIAIASVVLALGVEIAAIFCLLDAAMTTRISTPTLLISIFFIPVISRICAMIGAHRRFYPMRTQGFGALFIGHVQTWWVALWAFLALVLCFSLALMCAAPVMALMLSVSVALVVSIIVATICAIHCFRRFRGLNGDTNGFILEMSVVSCSVVFAVLLPLLP
ncbi:adenosylcobinamide-GDP ribazoletransferase [Corynebacterium sp. sy039]|uniref:adenosylcobinamide-GDP ribazoletransferase n=1 Tax=Corynebacterium sp. sy039 TaxID=2599641 RepID=UPI0011B4A844|nr:adenosylcobinamide-GDP ribazoletransferase [Corynebacterium sp. sy039]QDZ42953.1 adenosylcobinamide-GDP ribazoletransferase [Corynebacterium sp. sy039]